MVAVVGLSALKSFFSFGVKRRRPVGTARRAEKAGGGAAQRRRGTPAPLGAKRNFYFLFISFFTF